MVDSSSQSVYGLRWNPRPSLVRFYGVFAVLLCACSTAVSHWAVIAFPEGKVVSDFYFASLFYALSTYWFGGWGLVASYVGSVIGVGLFNGQGLTEALTFSVANVIEPLIPFLLVRKFGHRIGIHPLCTNIVRTPESMIWFLFFGALLPPFLSGLWGISTLRLVNGVQLIGYWREVWGWWVGASILLTLGIPVIGRLVGPNVERWRVGCQGIWS